MQGSRSEKTVKKARWWHRHGKHSGRHQVRVVLEKLARRLRHDIEPMIDPGEFFKGRRK